MSKKEFLINAVQMIDIDGSKNIPTVLYYTSDDEILIGLTAEEATTDRLNLNFDFKIDLGNYEPKSTKWRRNFITANKKSKSAVHLTADFLYKLVFHVSEWLAKNVIRTATSIVLAEPLAMQSGLVSSNWLSNYRRNLERLLIGKGFKSIDFLPEPFAVFQFYRYGLRHPIVAEQQKYHALVIDFGGGTFDVCIIETTKEGDISKTGRNSKPLAASSEPAGGFYFNRIIAEELFKKYVISKSTKAKMRRGLEIYSQWKRNLQDLSSFAEEYRNFVNNFNETIYRIENPGANTTPMTT